MEQRKTGLIAAEVGTWRKVRMSLMWWRDQCMSWQVKEQSQGEVATQEWAVWASDSGSGAVLHYDS